MGSAKCLIMIVSDAELIEYFTPGHCSLTHFTPILPGRYLVNPDGNNEIMKKSFVILLHIGFWACYFLLIGIIVAVYYRSGGYASDRQARIIIALQNIFLFAFLPSVVSFYSYYYLFPKYLQEKRYFLSVAVGILISVGGAGLLYILHRYLIETGYVIDMDQAGKHGRSTAVTVIFVMTFIGSLCGAVALVMRGFITWFNEIKLRQILKDKNHEMEMALIKSQLDPHLLFNTINNIDTLILRDPVEASDYLNKLSDIIRFVLYETTADKIPLSQEIEYIGKYIALQKIRTSNQTYAHFEVTGEVGNRHVAPMVFIPFIENAFKHTNNKKIKDAITVKVFVKATTTELICENRYDPNAQKQVTGGLGNELVRKRLDLIYAGKHTLNVSKGNELYRVHLTIPHEQV